MSDAAIESCIIQNTASGISESYSILLLGIGSMHVLIAFRVRRAVHYLDIKSDLACLHMLETIVVKQTIVTGKQMEGNQP